MLVRPVVDKVKEAMDIMKSLDTMNDLIRSASRDRHEDVERAVEAECRRGIAMQEAYERMEADLGEEYHSAPADTESMSPAEEY